MFKVCIISCGMISNSAHIPAYRNYPQDYNIVAVCDTNEAAAKDTAVRHGIPNFYTDAEQMLEREKPDIVSVCVPNFLHKKMTMLALSHDCHVLCEKPVAFTYRDAIEMYDYAKKQGKLLMACQSMRFTPDRLAAKKMIDRGELGDIYYGDFSRIRRRGIPTWGKFHIKEYSCGGAFVDIGVHMVDALLWLMGNPKLLTASATMSKHHAKEIGNLKDSGALTGAVHSNEVFNAEEMTVEDFSSGSLMFENGARVNFTVAWAANMPESSEIRLIGQKCGISIPDCKIYSASKDVGILPTDPPLYPNEPFFGHFYLFDNVRKVLNGKADPIVKPEETINTARILEAVYQSAEQGCEIKL